jgi:hypothetical protein
MVSKRTAFHGLRGGFVLLRAGFAAFKTSFVRLLVKQASLRNKGQAPSKPQSIPSQQTLPRLEQATTLCHYSGYVSVDWKIDGEDVEPLLWCLSFAVVDHCALDHFLRGILTGDGPSGGDPGWSIDRWVGPEGAVVYLANTDPDMSYLDPHEGVYDERTVFRVVRRALENLRTAHPKRSGEIDAVKAKYDL